MSHMHTVIPFLIGLVTNGEFNSVRLKGNTRPLNILQIKAEARAKYARKSKSTMLAMLTPKK